MAQPADVQIVQPGNEKFHEAHQMQMAPVTQQPAYGMAMGASQVPPGLEYLSTLNRVDVHQVLHLEEGMSMVCFHWTLYSLQFGVLFCCYTN